MAFMAASTLYFNPTFSLQAAEQHDHKEHARPGAAPTEAVAVLHPASGSKVQGIVRFVQDGNRVRVSGELQGLNPGQKHAMHIHEFGDCSAPDATSAGSHYNPEGHPHGLPNGGQRHAGDFGNVQADNQGRARIELTVENISILGARNPVAGRALIVHAKPDDGSQPTGNAGDRLACGVIGVAKQQKAQK